MLFSTAGLYSVTEEKLLLTRGPCCCSVRQPFWFRGWSLSLSLTLSLSRSLFPSLWLSFSHSLLYPPIFYILIFSIPLFHFSAERFESLLVLVLLGVVSSLSASRRDSPKKRERQETDRKRNKKDTALFLQPLSFSSYYHKTY